MQVADVTYPSFLCLQVHWTAAGNTKPATAISPQQAKPHCLWTQQGAVTLPYMVNGSTDLGTCLSLAPYQMTDHVDVYKQTTVPDIGHIVNMISAYFEKNVTPIYKFLCFPVICL